MPIRYFFRTLSNAPKPCSAILSMASQTDESGLKDKTRSSWASPLAKEREIKNVADIGGLLVVGKPTEGNSLCSCEIPCCSKIVRTFSNRRRLRFSFPPEEVALCPAENLHLIPELS